MNPYHIIRQCASPPWAAKTDLAESRSGILPPDGLPKPIWQKVKVASCRLMGCQTPIWQKQYSKAELLTNKPLRAKRASLLDFGALIRLSDLVTPLFSAPEFKGLSHITHHAPALPGLPNSDLAEAVQRSKTAY